MPPQQFLLLGYRWVTTAAWWRPPRQCRLQELQQARTPNLSTFQTGQFRKASIARMCWRCWLHVQSNAVGAAWSRTSVAQQRLRPPATIAPWRIGCHLLPAGRLKQNPGVASIRARAAKPPKRRPLPTWRPHLRSTSIASPDLLVGKRAGLLRRRSGVASKWAAVVQGLPRHGRPRQLNPICTIALPGWIGGKGIGQMAKRDGVARTKAVAALRRRR